MTACLLSATVAELLVVTTVENCECVYVCRPIGSLTAVVACLTCRNSVWRKDWWKCRTNGKTWCSIWPSTVTWALASCLHATTFRRYWTTTSSRQSPWRAPLSSNPSRQWLKNGRKRFSTSRQAERYILITKTITKIICFCLYIYNFIRHSMTAKKKKQKQTTTSKKRKLG